MEHLIHPLASQFLKAGSYLRGWSPKTVWTYEHTLRTLPSNVPSKGELEGWIIGMRERGLTPGGINLRIRAVNSFLTWLHEEGHASTHVRLKLLKAPKRQLTLLASADMRMLLQFRAKRLVQRRAHTLILLLLDTGIRITEALTIERAKVNLETCTLVVMGKGSKERQVPFSLECRKHLWRWLQKLEAGRLLFPTQSGGQLRYRNIYRDIQNVCHRAGVRTAVHPHLFRHCFAASYITQGGDLYRLSRLLGHTNITTTAGYLRSMGIEQIREHHDRLTPLAVRQ